MTITVQDCVQDGWYLVEKEKEGELHPILGELKLCTWISQSLELSPILVQSTSIISSLKNASKKNAIFICSSLFFFSRLDLGSRLIHVPSLPSHEHKIRSYRKCVQLKNLLLRVYTKLYNIMFHRIMKYDQTHHSK